MVTTETPELHVPPAAADAWFTCGCSESGIRSGYKPEALPVVVAAELRRIAEYFDRWATESGLQWNGLDDDTLRTAALSLRGRASELDPPAGVAEQQEGH